MLNVEWAMLTQPQRLDTLSQHVLQLAPIRTCCSARSTRRRCATTRRRRARRRSPIASRVAQVAEVSLKAEP